MPARTHLVDQAAQVLGVSRRTIYHMIRDGRLATTQTIGRSQRVTEASLRALPRRRRIA